MVVDNVGFSMEKLRDVAIVLEDYIGYRGDEEEILVIPIDIMQGLDELAKAFGMDRINMLRTLIEFGKQHREVLGSYAHKIRT